MVVKRYFYVQQLSFALCGIDTKAKKPDLIVKRPLLCYVPLFFAISHVVAIIHYAYVNRHDYVEVTDSLALSCQSLLAISKMLIFLGKRREFLELINCIHAANFKAGRQELRLIVGENMKDVKLCKIYFRTVAVAAFFAFMNPIFEALYIYYKSGVIILREPFKASYFWSHSELPGYSLVYLWNILSIYNLLGITLAIDTLFNWLISNISAQFHILCLRFNEAAETCSKTTSGGGDVSDLKTLLKNIKSCIAYHNQTVNLVEKLNHVYGEIIFVKFLISCLEICCLVFSLSRSSESMTEAVYKSTFLLTVAMQLMLYCYNGQRITDESLQVAPEIYFAFDWSRLPQSCKKLLLIAMMRSQTTAQLKGVFFVLDLSLFLWVKINVIKKKK